MDNGCYYRCMDQCPKPYSLKVCDKECNHSCATGVEMYKKQSIRVPSALYGAPSIQESLQESGPAAFIKKV